MVHLRPAGAGSIFPDRWEDFVKSIPKQEHGDLLQAYVLTGRCRQCARRSRQKVPVTCPKPLIYIILERTPDQAEFG
jgi:hypothetical protein